MWYNTHTITTGSTSKMKKQQTFTDLEYSSRKQITRRKEFLDTMDFIIPWDEFVELIRPHSYKNRNKRPSNDI